MCSDQIDTINLLHCNVRSLNRNYDTLAALLTRLKFRCNIIGLSETWLKGDEFVNLPSYRLLSLPRAADSRGGGVAFYISEGTTYETVNDITETNTGEYEMLFVELETKVTIGVIYRPPTHRMQAFLMKLEDVLQRFSASNKKAIICGNFNINTADCSGTEYLNLIASYGFQNHIIDPTRVTQTSSSTIDHILSNIDTEPIEAGVITENVADHFPVYIIAANSKPLPDRPFPNNIPRVNFEKTRELIQEKDFTQTLVADVNCAYKQFSATLKSSCVKVHFKSRRTSYFTRPICPWMTPQILGVIKIKEHWRQKMREHKDSTYYKEQYKVTRNLSLALMRKQKKRNITATAS